MVSVVILIEGIEIIIIYIFFFVLQSNKYNTFY